MKMCVPQHYSLRWNNYLHHITNAFELLRTGEDLVDVTLSCEGKKIRAHKILLSACSPYFRDLFKENPCQHPVIIFRDVKHADLVSIVDFMYQGEVSVAEAHLDSFLATAELLSIKGLTDGSSKEESIDKESEVVVSSPVLVEKDNNDGLGLDTPLVSNRQNFVSENKRSRPQQRKRKYNVPVPVPNDIDKKLCLSHVQEENIKDNHNDEPVEVIPLMSEVKLENEEFIDDSYEDITEETELSVNPLNKILRNCDLSVEPSASEHNTVNSPRLCREITSDLVDMEPVIIEPGTSSDMIQDSTQVEKPQDKTELNKQIDEKSADSVEVSTVQENQAAEEDDDYACDGCRQEKRLMKDLPSHKCPICREELFCSHLLKQHMTIIHGWFTVNRRYQ